MFFSKKNGFHSLLLYLNNDNPHPLFLIFPQEVANDVVATIKKLEKSRLNRPDFLGNWGNFQLIHEMQGFRQMEIFDDSLPWAQPLAYTDFASKIVERLQTHVPDYEDGNEDLQLASEDNLEDDLVFFIGEFTMMQDNGFVAPF